MTPGTQDKVREFAVKLTKLMKETQTQETNSPFVLVKARNLQALSSGLNGTVEHIEDIETQTLREMLLGFKAGLDWIIENKTISAQEAERLTKPKSI